MSCENTRQTFVMGTPTTYGSPNPRYIRPVVRINAMVQDAPVGYVINPCFLPMEEIAEATNQTIALAGSTLTLSDGGGSVELPTNTIATGTEPAIAVDAAIPTSVVGTDDYLLAKPTTYLSVVVDGVTYNIPAY